MTMTTPVTPSSVCDMHGEMLQALREAVLALAHACETSDMYLDTYNRVDAVIARAALAERTQQEALKCPNCQADGFCWDHTTSAADCTAKIIPCNCEFDAWQQNPYTKVLMKSISEDYVPKADCTAPMQPSDDSSAVMMHNVPEFPKMPSICDDLNMSKSDTWDYACLTGYRCALAAPTPGGEAVAWRYVPSAVWRDYVLIEDPERAKLAREHGIEVEPLFLAAPTQAAPAAQAVTGGEATLPHDITVGGATFRKGVKLSTFVLAAQGWHREAHPKFYLLTDEQKADNLAALMSAAAPAAQAGGGAAVGMRVFVAINREKKKLEAALTLACGYLTDEQAAEIAAAMPDVEAPAAAVEPVEMSPEFTDTARAALLWVLWHHQGGSSKVGQPIRFALGMGQHEYLNDHQIAEAKRWAELPSAAAVPEGLTDMRAVCEALGFDPTNHHNAAKCPYCRPASDDAKAAALTHEHVRAAGGIVHGDGNIFFTNIDKLRAAIAASTKGADK